MGAFVLTNKKAQTLTYDFFIAMGIFFIILTIIMGYWHYSMLQMQEISEKNKAVNTLFLSSQTWFKEGYPKYWGVTDVRELGMSNDYAINRSKMEMLSVLGYSKIASLLNLGVYNLQYTIHNASNSTLFQFPSGVDLTSAKNIYKIERLGILDEKPVNIRTIIWD
jgi:hypothetical protein